MQLKTILRRHARASLALAYCAVTFIAAPLPAWASAAAATEECDRLTAAWHEPNKLPGDDAAKAMKEFIAACVSAISRKNNSGFKFQLGWFYSNSTADIELIEEQISEDIFSLDCRISGYVYDKKKETSVEISESDKYTFDPRNNMSIKWDKDFHGRKNYTTDYYYDRIVIRRIVGETTISRYTGEIKLYLNSKEEFISVYEDGKCEKIETIPLSGPKAKF